MTKKETFSDVCKKIKTERDYQDTHVSEYFARHGKTDAIDQSRPIPAEILMMQLYLSEAAKQWTHVPGDVDTLDTIRKVVAMGVRCLEYHGCPEREDEQCTAMPGKTTPKEPKCTGEHVGSSLREKWSPF